MFTQTSIDEVTKKFIHQYLKLLFSQKHLKASFTITEAATRGVL